MVKDGKLMRDLVFAQLWLFIAQVPPVDLVSDELLTLGTSAVLALVFYREWQRERRARIDAEERLRRLLEQELDHRSSD